MKLSPSETNHKRIVITGGPGAGKTALLEIARKSMAERVVIIPEAATIIFRGGFWRNDNISSRKAVQRAIFHVQHELERMVEEENKYSACLCDRGTIDGLAYWPVSENELWADVHSSREYELRRYHAVIHLRTPSGSLGYNNENPVRIESPEEALAIDQKIEEAWADHPRRFIIESNMDFIVKVDKALGILKEQLPDSFTYKSREFFER